MHFFIRSLAQGPGLKISCQLILNRHDKTGSYRYCEISPQTSLWNSSIWIMLVSCQFDCNDRDWLPKSQLFAVVWPN